MKKRVYGSGDRDKKRSGRTRVSAQKTVQSGGSYERPAPRSQPSVRASRVPRLSDVILTGKSGQTYSLGDVVQMLEIDLAMGQRKDFHNRLLRTIRAILEATECSCSKTGKNLKNAWPPAESCL